MFINTMTDPKRLVKNTLFNPSVTGSTLEDFSQNALLLPAMEKPPLPPLNITPEQILQKTLNPQPPNHATQAELIPSETFTTQAPEASIAAHFEPQPQESVFGTSEALYEKRNAEQFTASNLTSVLSSFSNYLGIGGNSRPQSHLELVPGSAPAEPGNSVGANNIDAPPIPLYDPSIPIGTETIVPPSNILGQGTANSFRRPLLKKPVYAQIPGLVTGTSTVPQIPVQTSAIQNYFIPVQPSIQLQSPSAQTSVSPASSTSSIQDATFALNSQFKPINPQPAAFPPIKPNMPQPQHSSQPLNLEGPVMDAIPASEALSSQAQSASYAATDSGILPEKILATKIYRPVYQHWFYKTGENLWIPFSMLDSLALENAFISNDLDPDKVIATDGGRYDVNILRRQRIPVYWKGDTSEVRRCSWFYKNMEDKQAIKYVPYEENLATTLEEEFKLSFETNQWNREVKLSNGDTVSFFAPDLLVVQPAIKKPWMTTSNRIPEYSKVKRGMDEFDIDEGEPAEIDHLLFMVHGIGSVCDLKFRSVEEVVDEFRGIALQLTQSHYKTSYEQGLVHRIEVLPISWHGKLHSEETGVDEQLKKITLQSIPKLREFTNDTILDVLFYTSPTYSQTIISTVGDELNRIYNLFKQRNPKFNGGVSIGGHSLGSLIIFDLLVHQHDDIDEHRDETSNLPDTPEKCDQTQPSKATVTRKISYMMGSFDAGPKISYPHLSFKPTSFFALGSPIGMFVTVRGLDKLGENFYLPTCPAFFNIFHPYDPVAYRIEALINPELSKLKPVLIPHHKGRKRMHLELKETVARVGADLKQKVVDSMRSTWNSLYQFTMSHRSDQSALENEVNKNIQKHLEATPEEEQLDPNPQPEKTDIPLGNLNKGRRIDYVLQEAPFEFFNEYIFALTSHVCYWESEDTILLILKEIYSELNIGTDNQIPQQSMTIERLTSSQKSNAERSSPPSDLSTNLPPPPTSGFVRKT
ncbi:phospholipase DDHD2 isoform X2 [Anthonomus grandis grandis]|uniref:phospholipase DDHD2 isoform X2 n=1 Tax=Anthonomus grandis grandis TaxID=2921223 RepID=UPI0021661A97|nr:phospholipase DDHD2 isoform X2 [Anthonomus grandis grandis]